MVEGLIEVLDGQLDLEQIPVDDAVALYRNVAFAPMRATGIDEAALAATSVAEMQHVDLSAAAPALVESDGGGYRGPVSGDTPTIVQASSASDRWVLEVDGRRAERADAYGWANAFTIPGGSSGGDAVLGYRTPPIRFALLGVQGALWLLALLVVLRMRFRSQLPSSPSSPPSPADEPGASGTVDRAVGDAPDVSSSGGGDAPAREGEPEPVPAGAPT
jgi:hypothetical protein